MRNPMQPILKDERGVVRFKRNKIVDDLLRFSSRHGFDMNEIFVGNYTQDDREQFAQLIGYSICGFHELPYVSDVSAWTASAKAQNDFPKSGGCRDTHCDYHSGVEVEGEE